MIDLDEIALIEDPDRFSVYLAIDSENCRVDIEMGISAMSVMVELRIWFADDE